MARPASVTINLNAFRDNYINARKARGNKLVAVVKANAYGHGAVQCATAIDDIADAFGVACIEEAIELREAGITSPILLLEGFFESNELRQIVEYDLWTVVHNQWQIDVVNHAQLDKPITVWLKVNTGMHRLGMSIDKTPKAFGKLFRSRNVAKLNLMTHLSCADEPEKATTENQTSAFNTVLAECEAIADQPIEISIANSAGILTDINSVSVWDRAGIMLYGSDPLQQESTYLKPVMTFSSKIIATRNLDKNSSIGYGEIYTTDKVTIVGVVACGYADGYPRYAAHTIDNNFSGAPIMVNGFKTRVIGRVSMDMLFVDLTDIPNATLGSEVELWGERISANDVAQSASTISYELFCNVKRAHFNYLK
jgi:alanine racemase